jgi:hypothetical protein
MQAYQLPDDYVVQDHVMALAICCAGEARSLAPAKWSVWQL